MKRLLSVVILITSSLTAMEKKQKEHKQLPIDMMQKYAYLSPESQQHIENRHQRAQQKWTKKRVLCKPSFPVH